jgi:hypothetical protein
VVRGTAAVITAACAGPYNAATRTTAINAESRGRGIAAGHRALRNLEYMESPQPDAPIRRGERRSSSYDLTRIRFRLSRRG